MSGRVIPPTKTQAAVPTKRSLVADNRSFDDRSLLLTGISSMESRELASGRRRAEPGESLRQGWESTEPGLEREIVDGGLRFNLRSEFGAR